MAAARYDAHARWYHEWVSSSEEDFAARALLGCVGEVRGARVLDLACGQGRIARTLAERGAEVVGVDLSVELLDIASSETDASLPISYIVGDATTTTWWDGSTFAGVVCSVALMDIDDLGAALGAVARVLEPGGWFVFSLLHPCFVGDADRNSSWPTERDYFAEGWWTSGNDRISGRVGRNHRTLATYLNALTPEFDLLSAVETNPDDQSWSPPLVLVLRWRRRHPGGRRSSVAVA